MRETVKLALRLCLFTLVSGMLLAVTNALTRGPIADQLLASSQSAQMKALAEAVDFEKLDIPLTGYADVTAVSRGYDGDETIGYVLSMAPMGYNDKVLMTLGITVDGAITQLIIEDENETVGLGSRITEPAYLDQYPGRAANKDIIGSEVDAISGATVSSGAVMGAVERALLLVENELGITGKANRALADAHNPTDAETQRMSMLEGGRTIYELLPFSAFGYDAIVSVYKVRANGGFGYVFDAAVSEPISVVFSAAISPLGLINDITIDEPHETHVLTEDYLNAFIGKSAENAISSSGAAEDAEAEAFKNGLSQVISFYMTHVSGQEG